MATAEELHKKLEAIKQQRARLEGQRDQTVQELKSLGFETPAAVKAELDSIEEFLKTAEPAYESAYAKFVEDFGTQLEGF